MLAGPDCNPRSIVDKFVLRADIRLVLSKQGEDKHDHGKWIMYGCPVRLQPALVTR